MLEGTYERIRRRPCSTPQESEIFLLFFAAERAKEDYYANEHTAHSTL